MIIVNWFTITTPHRTRKSLLNSTSSYWNKWWKIAILESCKFLKAISWNARTHVVHEIAELLIRKNMETVRDLPPNDFSPFAQVKKELKQSFSIKSNLLRNRFSFVTSNVLITFSTETFVIITCYWYELRLFKFLTSIYKLNC